MRIHVTKKLAEKLQKAGRLIEETPAESTSVLGGWHANITTIQRRQCVVFTHDQTRFTIVLLGVTAKELEYWFEDMLGNCMLKLGYSEELIQRACTCGGTYHGSGAESAQLCDRPCRVKGMKGIAACGHGRI